MSGSLLERKAHLLSCLTVFRHFRVKSTFKTEKRKPCKHAYMGSESASLRIKAPVYLHAEHQKEKFKDTCSLWEKWFRLVGCWEMSKTHTFLLAVIPRQWEKSQPVLPRHIPKGVLAPPSSSSQAARGLGKAHPLLLGFYPMLWDGSRLGPTRRWQNH